MSHALLYTLLTNFSCIFADENSCEFGSGKYYALCGFGGILSCGITHTAVVPLDLVKCRIQVLKFFSLYLLLKIYKRVTNWNYKLRYNDTEMMPQGAKYTFTMAIEGEIC